MSRRSFVHTSVLSVLSGMGAVTAAVIQASRYRPEPQSTQPLDAPPDKAIVDYSMLEKGDALLNLDPAKKFATFPVLLRSNDKKIGEAVVLFRPGPKGMGPLVEVENGAFSIGNTLEWKGVKFGKASEHLSIITKLNSATMSFGTRTKGFENDMAQITVDTVIRAVHELLAAGDRAVMGIPYAHVSKKGTTLGAEEVTFIRERKIDRSEFFSSRKGKFA